MTDQNRKTLRSFYCRDYLWEHFEQMAQELGCSMDYLINESMRLYARNRDESAGAESAGEPVADKRGEQQQVGPGGGPSAPAGGPGGSRPRRQKQRATTGNPSGGGQRRDANGPPPARGSGGGDNHETFQQVPAVGGNNGRSQSSQGGGGPASQPGNPGGPPPPPPRPGQGGGGSTSNPGRGQGDNWQQGQQNSPPQPPEGGIGGDSRPGGGPNTGQPPLYLTFNNNRYVIDQQKYVIGRGSKHTDLTIRDGNISRKHCAIIYRNGSYYIKDLDSTNGVEYRGNRIESKKIEEGDVFYLCDYDLRFSFRG